MQQQFASIMFPSGRKAMTVMEVAAMLHCTDQHVCDLIDEGQLQALNIGGNAKRYWRIPREAYLTFLRSRSSLEIS